jgi:hypothetical protein
MNRFEDPFGDVGPLNSQGARPNRYGAARYLARRKGRG